MSTLNFPLEWPAGWKRTPIERQRRAPYTVSQDKAQRELVDELRRMGAHHVVISTNIPVRRDGMPYANAREPADAGVAVYFVPKGQTHQHVIACDQWYTVRENLRALGLTVAALRQMERTGASGILDRAYSGFLAIEGPRQDDHWASVLQLGNHATADEVERHFRLLAQQAHPDKPGGSVEQYQRLVAARDAAREQFAERRAAR